MRVLDAAVHVVNLDRSGDRLAYAAGEIAREWPGAWERVPGVDGRALDLDRLRAAGLLREADWLGRALRPGEVGCWLAHWAACGRVAASDRPMGIVIEDDVTLAVGFARSLATRLDRLGEAGVAWDLAYLGCYEGITGFGPDFSRSERLPGDFFRLHRGNRGCPGAYGYVLTRAGAARLRDALRGRPITMPIDEDVPRLGDDGMLTIVCASPALVVPAWCAGVSFPSTIVTDADEPRTPSEALTEAIIRAWRADGSPG